MWRAVWNFIATPPDSVSVSQDRSITRSWIKNFNIAPYGVLKGRINSAGRFYVGINKSGDKTMARPDFS